MLKKIILLSIPVMVLYLPVSAQSFERRSIGHFSRIEFYGDVEVELMPDQDEWYQIKRLNELTEKDIKITLEGSVLKVRTKADLNNTRRAYLVIGYKEIISLKAYNGADIYCDSAMPGDAVSVTISSGSNGHLAFVCRNLQCEISSGGLLVARGHADMLTASVVTGSTFDGNGLITAEAKIMSSTGSKVYVHCTAALTAHATLEGEIHYAGNPEKRKFKNTLGGIINPINE